MRPEEIVRRGSSVVAASRSSAKQNWRAATARTREAPAANTAAEETLSDDDLRGRQAKAIPALLAKPTLGAAARAAGVGERTLRRWLSDDAGFMAAYREDRSEAMRQATARLQAAAGEAVDTLRELMGMSRRPDIRARAALGILATAAKAEELENLAARIEALEQLRAQSGGSQWPKVAANGR